MIKYPKLVLSATCKTPIHVNLYSENISEDGEPEENFEEDLYCNYQNTSKRIYDKYGTYTEITGTALFSFDFCPQISTISGGEVIIFGESRKVKSGAKMRNPDGTVNYVRLDIE